VSLALGGALFTLPGCRRESQEERSPASAPRAGYVLHEWGLFGGVANSQALEIATSSHSSLPVAAIPVGMELPQPTKDDWDPGWGTSVGKPVIYAHLDPGVESVTFDLVSELANGRFEERYPGARNPGTTLRFDDVRVTRGACRAPMPTPTRGEDPACRTSDGFCEAIEIPRYVAEGGTCLRVGAAESSLLFYRASGLAGVELPLGLNVDAGGRSTTSRGPATRP
jgi:hypothetical protein